MSALLKIVVGNEYPIKIYVDQMGYSGTTLSGTAVDLREIQNLQVYAVHSCGYCHQVLLRHIVSEDGSYVTVIIPADKTLKLGNWGIRLTGAMNGRKVASAEKAIFSLVKWNGQSYVPPTMVDGEGSYILNLKFASGDMDIPIEPGEGSEGWIGFDTFSVSEPPVSSDVSDVDLEDLTHVDNIIGSYTLTTDTQDSRLVVVAPAGTFLSFQIGGMPASLYNVTYSNKIYYFSDELDNNSTFLVEIL